MFLFTRPTIGMQSYIIMFCWVLAKHQQHELTRNMDCLVHFAGSMKLILLLSLLSYHFIG